MTTLFNAMYETALLSGVLVSGTGTNLGPTTITDTKRVEVDDYFNNGTIFFLSGSLSGKAVRVVDYTQASGLITFDTQQTGSDSSALYALTNQSRDAFVQAVNAALTYMGEYTAIDETLTITQNTTEYTLPAGISNVKRIEMYITDSQPYGFSPVLTWREFGGKIYLPYALDNNAGYKIRLYYNTFHPAVNADSDVISDNYNLKRLAWTSTYMFMLNRMQYSGNTDEREMWLLSNAQTQATRLANAFPVHHIERDPILARW